MSKPLLALFMIVCLFPPVSFPRNLTFTKIKYMQPVGDKATEIKAKLTLTNQSIGAYNAKTGETLNKVLWGDLKLLTYSKSKHPRWKTGVGLFPWLSAMAIPFFFLKRNKHWLTVQTTKNSSRGRRLYDLAPGQKQLSAGAGRDSKPHRC